MLFVLICRHPEKKRYMNNSFKDSLDTFDKFNNSVDREKQFCYMVDDYNIYQ